MKVKMLRTNIGLINGNPFPPVDAVVDVDEMTGAYFCASGYAEPVATANDKRTASTAAPETR